MALSFFTPAKKKATGTKSGKRTLRKDIQGLRMVAVVAVVLDHLLGWPAGGFVGVDVFFVISGFLITGLLLREHNRTGTISFIGFYRNRIRRIAPAATLVLLVTVAASWFVFNQSRFLSVTMDSVSAFFFAANWHFAAAGTNYFEAGGPESPLQHFWSLAVEEQFYFVWPWLMLLIFFFAGRRAQWDSKRVHLAIGIAMAVITVTSFAWAMWETANNPTVAYFSTLSRTWELGIGALIAVFAAAFHGLTEKTRWIVGHAGLLGIIASVFVITSEAPFPAPWAVLPVFATAAVIIAGTGDESRAPKLLTNAVAGYIGNISYSLYLWHFPAIIICGALIGTEPLSLLICAAAFTLAAVYSFHLVEEPIRHSNWLNRKDLGGKRSQTLTEGYKLTALSLLAVVTAAVVLPLLLTPQATPPQVAAPSPKPLATTGGIEQPLPETGALQAELTAALGATEWPALSPTFEEVIAGRPAPDDVMPCGLRTVDEAACTWGDPSATKTIVTIGNSISMTYVAALRAAVGTTDGWNIKSYGMFGCPIASSEGLAKLQTLPAGCTTRAEEAIAAINRINPAVVVVAGVSTGAETELRKITAVSKLVFLPGPPVDKDIKACYSRVSKPVDCVSKIPQGWGVPEQALAAAFGQGVYVDPQAWFCVKASCPSFAGTVPVRLDKAHMTAAYAERIAPAIRETLDQQEVLTAS